MREIFWLARVAGIPCNVFNSRREAVVWLKELLAQESRDFEKQSMCDEFDYAIRLRELTIEPFEKRDSFLGL